MKSPVPESGVLRACLDLLAAEKIWHLRMNTGAMKIGKRFTRFGRPGTADILASPRIMVIKETPELGEIEHIKVDHSQFLWLECKSSNGRQTHEQRAFEEEVRRAGHAYLLVRDVDTLRDWLKTHGVIGKPVPEEGK